MSQPKITSKNLSYSSDLPPFLARLRGHQEQQRDSDSPDPILAARRRAVRPRSKSEEAEDAPLVVDETGNTVAFPSGADADTDGDTPDAGHGDFDGKNASEIDTGKEKGKEKEKVAGIGAGKKRKVGRVVGGDEEEVEEKNVAKATDRARDNNSKTKKEKEGKSSTDAKSGMKQGRKKAKKIKLSFGDDAD
ncbi:hypothetical protein GGS26DRAFT_588853 [Hypomontagnella submonticulosa]|nr:hypothetical protein GGS26DRAFT_588853 [Hypomontagnella submonticulosa]